MTLLATEFMRQVPLRHKSHAALEDQAFITILAGGTTEAIFGQQKAGLGRNLASDSEEGFVCVCFVDKFYSRGQDAFPKPQT